MVTFEELGPVGSPQHLDPAPVYQTVGTVNKDAKPGTYAVTFVCGEVTASQSFKVLPPEPAAQTPPTAPKQVTEIPVGAPQTGGTDGPVDGSSSGLAMAAGAMGVLTLGGAAAVLVRRRPRG
ncbi:hypothetical protein QRX50_02905 [Amycolatopsis carbonis]|uniref:Gram-positive cocci surface proteins LPxTG domain-containing protein n=1 Tax=Amycolatopsis carbonis TaxID=715471 RepID=A0A9Y2MYD7_9PSEU|nr:hypothetical protein [Amycolatopsis sp. 2-15]WIX79767.1 hypothetical protein QRX50_02905 [Amycolatopsis sp. 2-15]